MASSEECNDKVKIKSYLSENIKDLADVYLAHKKSLEACEEEIIQWEKFIKDYNVLQEKLSTYPDKTSYDEVIPIGSLAYMKGKKIHTNEILVHLGENWFAERSVKDALAIIARRKEVCNDKLTCTKKLKTIHEGWLKQTRQLAEEGQVEIMERVSEEEYQKDKERHEEMVGQHLAFSLEGEGEGKPDVETSISSEIKTFEDLLKRLDVLEEEERIKDELVECGDGEEGSGKEQTEKVSSSDEREDGPSAVGKEKLRRRVSWADQLAEQKHRDDDDEDEDDDDTDDKRSHSDTVKIKYRARQQSLPAELISSTWEKEKDEDGINRTPSQESATAAPEEEEGVAPQEEEEGEGAGAEADLVTPQSPSDLYKMFGPHAEVSLRSQPTKSILKKKGDSFQAEDTEKGVGWSDTAESITYIPSSPDEPVLLPRKLPLSESPKEIKNLKPAFSYKVVARDIDDPSLPITVLAGSSMPQAFPDEPDDDGEEEDIELASNEEPKKISRFKASRMKQED